MISRRLQNITAQLALPLLPLSLLLSHGCQSPQSHAISQASPTISEVDHETLKPSDGDILQTAFEQESKENLDDSAKSPIDPVPPSLGNELPALEAAAIAANPRLLKLQQQANAGWAKTRYLNKLPDPTIGANVFGNPIETAAGSQRANMSVMQMIPWLDRLDAQQQQACYEAMAQQKMYEAEALRIVGDVRSGYYRLYILHRQIETIQANQELIETLIEIANSRIATGQATQGDVLLGTLELSRLEEQLITLQQQVRSTEAELNRIMNRPSEIAIIVPGEIELIEPNWTHQELVQTAFQQQPMIATAHLQVNASRWGVTVAELRRKPDFQVGASYFFTEGNRPNSNVVNVGQDPFAFGATMTIPLDREKYDAIRDEALWKHAASSSNVVDVQREFDAKLRDLLEQARAANETAALYRNTIIPQSEQTLRADQEALINGTVEFDRVVQDFRNLLTLEFGYHRSVGNLAISVARIRQAVGVDLQPSSSKTN